MSTIAPPRPSQKRNGLGTCDPRPATKRLGAYTTPSGERREVVCVTGTAETRLLIDRIRGSARDARLVAHLAADEPAENAQRICDLYVADTDARACRSLTGEDFERASGEGASSPGARVPHSLHVDNGVSHVGPLVDRRGRPYRLQPCDGCGSIEQLRWCRVAPEQPERPEPVSLRHVIGAVESYEPARTLTLMALERYAHDERVSTALLRGELERVSLSPIVLNRGLREAVQRRLASGELTMSEIAIRCGRLRRGERGAVSGETSWLARRIGQVPEAGHAEPTAWIHSDVLALIARGLCVSPNEVEL
jgi:hypothetical protein